MPLTATSERSCYSSVVGPCDRVGVQDWSGLPGLKAPAQIGRVKGVIGLHGPGAGAGGRGGRGGGGGGIGFGLGIPAALVVT